MVYCTKTLVFFIKFEDNDIVENESITRQHVLLAIMSITTLLIGMGYWGEENIEIGRAQRRERESRERLVFFFLLIFN